MFFNPLDSFTPKYVIRSLIYTDYGPVMGSGSSQWEHLATLKSLSASLGLATQYKSRKRGSEECIYHDGNDRAETKRDPW